MRREIFHPAHTASASHPPPLPPLTILPSKTMNQKMPPLNMLLHVPPSWIAERKQLVAVCDKLHGENAWLLSRMVLYVGVAFVAGLVLGALSTWGSK